MDSILDNVIGCGGDRGLDDRECRSSGSVYYYYNKYYNKYCRLWEKGNRIHVHIHVHINSNINSNIHFVVCLE